MANLKPSPVAFMRVVEDIDRMKSFNKYLLRPLVGGEIVRIARDQNPSTGISVEAFQKRYVRIVRKDDGGLWVLEFVTTWDALEPLGKK